MRTLRFIVAFSAIAFSLHGQAAPLVHEGESPPARAWRLAIEAGDLAALAQMHDAQTVAFPPNNEETKGRDAIMTGYADLFAHFRVTVDNNEAYWVENGPLVVSWGITTLHLHPKTGGAEQISRSRFTDAAFFQGGHWVYLVDHASKPTRK
jgi:ketosteroid isomerase-like protein